MNQRTKRARFWTAIAVCLMAASCVIGVPNRGRDRRPEGWDRRQGPTVPHDTFPADCSICHISENWHTLRSDFTFDHAAQTGVPLNGAHATAQCLRCHNDRGPVDVFSQRGCSGCHSDPHSAQLGSNCTQCHNERNWRATGQIAKHALTRFPLVGAHVGAACFRCHPGAQVNNFRLADTHCESCHRSDLQRTANPDHTAMGWVHNCEKCHTPIEWGSGGFVHTAFPLTGGHSAVACAACHVGGVYSGLSHDCSSCHLDDFQATTSPNHLLAGFSQQCQDCHSTVSWGSGGFIHDKFPLTGGHQAVDCTQCHTGGVYTGLSHDCSSCHLDDFQATTSPNHTLAGFSQQCQDCHSTVSWGSGGFIHDKFPLTGGHQAVDCTQCHTGGVYTGLSHDCSSCHLDDFQTTTSPNHTAAGFSVQCQDCHSTVTWGGAGFLHDKFPLTGAHQAVDCTLCHVGGVYSGLSHDCSSCHLSDYQGTTDPNHISAGFSMQCQDCHTTITWAGATFAHNTFPLTGAHQTVSCAACHPGGVYAGTPQACSACHLDDYQAASNPNHASLGFPMNCEQCHNTTTWQGATFNHTFNITSGPHRVYSCTECHRVPGNINIVSCTHCHEHNQSTADGKHREVPGYIWDSNACIGCHPTGRH